MGAGDVGQTRPEDSWEFTNLPAVITNHIFNAVPFFFERNENLFENWEQNINDFIVCLFFLMLELKPGYFLSFISYLCHFWSDKHSQIQHTKKHFQASNEGPRLMISPHFNKPCRRWRITEPWNLCFCHFRTSVLKTFKPSFPDFRAGSGYERRGQRRLT